MYKGPNKPTGCTRSGKCFRSNEEDVTRTQNIDTPPWQLVIFTVCALCRAVYITATTLISVAKMVTQEALLLELMALRAFTVCVVGTVCHMGRTVVRALKAYTAEPECKKGDKFGKSFYEQHGYGIVPIYMGGDGKRWV